MSRALLPAGFALAFAAVLLPEYTEPSPFQRSPGASMRASHLHDDAQALDFGRIAGVIVERMALERGERVLLVAARGRFDPLVAELGARMRRSGAEYLGAVSVDGDPPRSWRTDFTRALDSAAGARLRRQLEEVDLAVMLPGASPGDTYYAAIVDLLRTGRGRTIHFHWAGAYALDGSALEIDDRIDNVYQRALTDTDYAALGETQRRLERAMRGREVRVTTPLGTDIAFRIGDRPVTRQDGDASATRAGSARNLVDREVELPAGAIRVAPLEETVHGTIAFPDATWAGATVTGLTLRFEAGRVVDARASAGLAAVEAELSAGGSAAGSFREFALGMNPHLAVPSAGPPWIPYYGYGAGVVRLSLGDNQELGGAVEGEYVRWNFFTDATVRIGEEIWVRDGRLLAKPEPTSG